MAVYKLKENTFLDDNIQSDYERKMKIASLLSKNNKAELDAIEGYQDLLSIVGDEDKELVDTINEIISDEKNHSKRLTKLTRKYDKIAPNKS